MRLLVLIKKNLPVVVNTAHHYREALFGPVLAKWWLAPQNHTLSQNAEHLTLRRVWPAHLAEREVDLRDV